jgi:hypothetical protein
MTGKTNRKRLPKGQRTHIRRMKQETRREGNTYIQPKRRRTPVKATGE